MHQSIHPSLYPSFQSPIHPCICSSSLYLSIHLLIHHPSSIYPYNYLLIHPTLWKWTRAHWLNLRKSELKGHLWATLDKLQFRMCQCSKFLSFIWAFHPIQTWPTNLSCFPHWWFTGEACGESPPTLCSVFKLGYADVSDYFLYELDCWDIQSLVS